MSVARGGGEGELAGDPTSLAPDNILSRAASLGQREDMWRAYKTDHISITLDYRVPRSHDMLLNNTKGGPRHYIVGCQ